VADELERAPCPRCAEPAALAAQICPHCHQSLAVDLRLGQSVADDRLRYRAARLTSELGPPVPGFGALRDAMANPKPVLVRNVTREVAAAITDALWSCGIEAETVVSEGRGDDGLVSVGKTIAAGALRGAMGSPRLLAWLGGAALLLLVGLGIVFLRRMPLSTTALAARVRPATVSIKCTSSVGSGFFVKPDLVLTNAHVLCNDGRPPQVNAADGRSWTAEVVKSDVALDLALLRVPNAGGTPLELGDATALAAGERVVAVGSPLGLADSVIEGKVSHVGRPMMGVSYVQVDANVNHGMSGGPVVDGRGRAVAVVTMVKLDEKARGIGLALPINYAYYREAFVSGPPQQDWRGLDTAGATRWQTLLADAEAQEAKDKDEVATAFYRPGVVAAVRGPNGLVAVVLLRAGLRPDALSGNFSVQGPGGTLCRGTFPITGWKNVDRESPMDSPQLQWMRRNHLADNLFVGAALLRAAGCASYDSVVGAEVVLEDGDPTARRVKIEAAGE